MIFVFLGLVAGFGGLLAIASLHFPLLLLVSCLVFLSLVPFLVFLSLAPLAKRALTASAALGAVSQEKEESWKMYFFSFKNFTSRENAFLFILTFLTDICDVTFCNSGQKTEE